VEKVSSFVAALLDGLWEFAEFLLLLVVVLLVAATWEFVGRAMRKAPLRRSSGELGLEFDAALEVPTSLRRARVFDRGQLLELREFLHGKLAGRPFLMFRHELQLGHAEHSSNMAQTVNAFRTEAGTLPAFTMQPRLRVRLPPFLSPRGPSHKSFAKAYQVKGDDERAVRSLFSAPVLDFFSRERGWWIEATGEWLVLYKPGRRVPQRRLVHHLRKVSEIARLFDRPKGGEGGSEQVTCQLRTQSRPGR
jgi:hypothetical protein